MKLSSCDVTSCNDLMSSRKGGTGGGGWVHLKGADSMAVSGLSFRNTLVGSGWAISVLLCPNGLKEQSSHLARCHFWWGSFPSQEEQLPTKKCGYCKLINGWVWFES